MAGTCGHVFHKMCLTGVHAAECPECGQKDIAARPLDLFGASFGEDVNCTSANVAVSRVLEEMNTGSTSTICLDDDDEANEASEQGSDSMRNELIRLVTLRQELETKQLEYDKCFESAVGAREAESRQNQKLAKVESTVARRNEKCVKLLSELDKLKHKSGALTEEVQQRRQRDAVREYYDILKSKSAAQALSFLTTIVKLADDPAPFCIELARLKEHHRNELQRRRRECAVESRKQVNIKLDLEERRTEVAAFKRKLGRSRTSPSPLPPPPAPVTSTASLPYLAAKRIRTR